MWSEILKCTKIDFFKVIRQKSFLDCTFHASNYIGTKFNESDIVCINYLGYLQDFEATSPHFNKLNSVIITVADNLSLPFVPLLSLYKF